MRRAITHPDLPAIAKLAVAGTRGITRLAEAVHQSVWSALGFRGADDGRRTTGLTGAVYRAIDAITDTVDTGLQVGLASLAGTDVGHDGPARLSWLGALNGVIGDRLVATDNPLAIPMQWRLSAGGPCWQPGDALPDARERVLVLIHGLCMHDGQWSTRDADGLSFDHGVTLAAHGNRSLLYLRYNTGLSIADNGAQLAAQLATLQQHWPVPIRELSILGHSMGGLITRSAIADAQLSSADWLSALRHVVYLGTPHLGAPLERAGHWVDRMLLSSRFGAPFAEIGLLRSRGITDLRHGMAEQPALPPGTRCYAIAASTSDDNGSHRPRGDGLVGVSSALGCDRHGKAMIRLDGQTVVYRTDHFALLRSPVVARQLEEWFGA